MSPCGTRFLRTPEDVAAYEKGKSSNEKPTENVDVKKVNVDAAVDVDVGVAMKLEKKVDTFPSGPAGYALRPKPGSGDGLRARNNTA